MTERTPYIHLYPDDWRSGTMLLTPIEEWAYLQVCLYIWDKGDAMPEKYAPLVLARDPDWQQTLASLVDHGKVKKTADGYVVRRAKNEKKRAEKRLKTRKMAGKLGAEKRWKNNTSHSTANGNANGSAIPFANGNQNQNQNHKVPNGTISPPKSPSKSKSKNPARPDDVEPQVWADWKAVRKAPITATALDGVRREAEKAGLSLNQAIRISAESGWRGFKAEWIRNRHDRQTTGKTGNGLLDACVEDAQRGS